MTRILLFLSLTFLLAVQPSQAQTGKDATWTVRHTDDFAITGTGTSEQWEKTEWMPIEQLRGDPERSYETKAKVLYSDTGFYFLFHCEDSVLNATLFSDFSKLWLEDVVELFLWPDESVPFYFEYELSPLNYELAILVHDRDGHKTRWRPYYHEFGRRIRHQTSAEGGDKVSRASVTSWTGEIYIPYEYLYTLNNVPPEPGDRWRANLYRIDYDGEGAAFAWQPVETNFHQYEKFGTFIFE